MRINHVAAGVEATHVPQHQHGGGGAAALRRRRRDEGHRILQKETLCQQTEEPLINFSESVLPLSLTEEEETEGRKESCDWSASPLYSDYWVCL